MGGVAAAPSYTFYNNPTTPNTSTQQEEGDAGVVAWPPPSMGQATLGCYCWLASVLHDKMKQFTVEDEDDEEEEKHGKTPHEAGLEFEGKHIKAGDELDWYSQPHQHL